jgi:hypothetical protein
MMKIKMKPETIARRRAEALTEAARLRELFLKTYAGAQAELGLPPVPETGSRYSSFLPDGRCVIISADRLTVF